MRIKYSTSRHYFLSFWVSLLRSQNSLASIDVVFKAETVRDTIQLATNQSYGNNLESILLN